MRQRTNKETIDLIMHQYTIEDGRRDREVHVMNDREHGTIRDMNERAGIERLRAISACNERVVDNVKYVLACGDTVVDLVKEIEIVVENGEAAMDKKINEINDVLRQDVEELEARAHDEIMMRDNAMGARLYNSIRKLLTEVK